METIWDQITRLTREAESTSRSRDTKSEWRRARIVKLETEVADQKSRIDLLANDHASCEKGHARVYFAQGTKCPVCNFRAQAVELSRWNEEKRIRIAELKHEVDDLTAAAAKRDKTIEELQAGFQACMKGHVEVNYANGTDCPMCAEIRTRQDIVADRHTTVATLTEERERLFAAISVHTTRITELEKQLAATKPEPKPSVFRQLMKDSYPDVVPGKQWWEAMRAAYNFAVKAAAKRAKMNVYIAEGIEKDLIEPEPTS